jgi:predicted O-methyltransferase YrrM
MSLKRYIKYLFRVDDLQTQTTRAEQAGLIKYASGKKTAVEIGVYEGVNTVTLAGVLCNDGILYGIDPFFPGRLGISYQKQITVLNIRRNNLQHKIKLIEKTSDAAADDIPAGIDFIFVDGDHSLEGIRKDWDIYSNKLATGGIIALHDSGVFFYPGNPVQFGSVDYYKEVISKDPRFVWLEKIDSTNFLCKL